MTCWWKIENFHFFFCHVQSLYKIEEKADPKEPGKEIVETPAEIKLEPKDDMEQSDLSINKILNELITSNLELNEMDSELGEVVLFTDVADDKNPESLGNLAKESEVLVIHEENNEEEVIHEIVIDDEDEEEDTEFVIQLQEDECLDAGNEILPLFEINSKLVGNLEFEEMETEIVIEEDEPTQDQENQEKPEPEEKDSKIFKYCSRVCEFCDHEFFDFKDVKKHYKESHQVNGFLRCCGNKKFFKKFSLYEHILSHDNSRVPECVAEKSKEPKKQKSYECEICHQFFLFEKHLKLHSFKAHKIDVKKVFECSFCDRFFHTKLAQKTHVDQEHLKKNSCPICKLTFLNKILLNQHLKLHKKSQVKG